MNRANVKSFLVLLPICFGLLLIGAFVDGEVEERTGQCLVDHVLPRAAAPTVAAEVEEEIPIEELPETYWAWHLSLFLHDNWREIPEEVALVTHFSVDARLAKLKRQVYSHVYTPSNPLYRMRYAKSIKSLPAVRLQQQDGKVIYQVGNALPVPTSARKLGNDIAKAIKERCPFPRPRPEPEPSPRPNPTPIPDMPVPDISPDQPDEADAAEEEDEELTTGQIIGIGVLLMVVAAGVSVLLAAKKDALG